MKPGQKTPYVRIPGTVTPQHHPKQVLRCAPLLLSFLQCSYMYNHTISGILYVTKSEETWHILKTRAYGAMRVLVVAQIEKRQVHFGHIDVITHKVGKSN